jgi:cystathionine beta-lyase
VDLAAQEPVPTPLAGLSLDRLRERQSVKWRMYEPDVLPMFVAEMDCALAPPVAAALAGAVRRGDTGYAWPGRLPGAFGGFASRRFGWWVDPADVRVIPDVMRGVVEVLRVLTGPGDGVVVDTPAYPPFFSALAEAHRRVTQCPMAPDGLGRYAIDLDGLERAFAEGARAYLLCNPHNPTGVVHGRDVLLAVAELADRYRVRILVDEIHAPLTYPGVPFTPFLTLADVAPAAAAAVTFHSASKAWNLPGLKAAVAVPGPAAREDLERMPLGVQFGTGLFGVLAAVAAFEAGEPWLDALLRDLDGNRRLLADLLADLLPRVRYRMPDATYLAWLDCRELDLGDDPAERFLARGRVALNAGPTFGPPGRGFARLNLATSPELITEGVRRMAAALG